MTTLYYVLAGLIVGDIALTIFRIGRPRQPLTGLDGTLSLIQYGAVVWLLIVAAGAR